VARVQLPAPVDKAYTPFAIDTPGTWLILSDVHLPFHDRRVVELAVTSATKSGARGVLLNGDILDSHELSTFDKTPEDPRYVDEIKAGKQFLAYFRDRLPKARIVYKDGNHEERLISYLTRRAPALFGLELLSLPSLLEFKTFGVEHVSDRRVIQLGRLNVVHGHEYRPNITAPVNPARGLFLRAKASAICGHLHQTSEHHEPTIAGKPLGCWSVGCACQLNPQYSPLNRWNHGFALVDVDAGGGFSVRNLRVLNGKTV
jgi:predicted phosphodiesterase